MPKINYHRGESREFVRRRDPGTWGRKRQNLWVGYRHRPSRGRGSLARDYYGLDDGPGANRWCPCCVGPVWDRRTRSAKTRREQKHLAHRLLRNWEKLELAEMLAEFRDDR